MGVFSMAEIATATAQTVDGAAVVELVGDNGIRRCGFGQIDVRTFGIILFDEGGKPILSWSWPERMDWREHSVGELLDAAMDDD